MQAPFSWDQYSDQPHQIKDKQFKKNMRMSQLSSLIKTFLTALIIIPISLLSTPFIRRKTIDTQHFFSIGVDYTRYPQETLKFLNELNNSTILVRLKLWELQTLKQLKKFLEENKKQNRKIILKIIQDREHIENIPKLEKNLYIIFEKLNHLVDIFEIGTTINRAKWGFFSVDEYNKFYLTAYNLKQQHFQNIELMGSGVIDFEFHFTAHTLFNFEKYSYDATSSLLYVDRRGAPENIQIGFSLIDKIALLSTMVWISPKSKHKLHITETNWPITNTAPYAPTSEKECVSLEEYTNFMIRYHLLAFASQQINTLSWHQLIATGYGLIDQRNNLKKYPAFQAYKIMLSYLQKAQFLRMDIKRGYYIFQALLENKKLLQIHWSLKETTLKKENDFKVYNIYGEKIDDEILTIGSMPLYIIFHEK